MAAIVPRQTHYVCRACRAHASRAAFSRSFATTIVNRISLREQIQSRDGKQGIVKTLEGLRDRALMKPKRPEIPAYEKKTTSTEHITTTFSMPDVPQDVKDNPAQALANLQADVLAMIEASEHIPTSAETNALLKRALQVAYCLNQAPDSVARPQPSQVEQSLLQTSRNSNSLLGDLDEAGAPVNTAPVPAPTSLSKSQRAELSEDLARSFYTLLEDPKLAISEGVLTNYVTLLVILGFPEYAPKIFELYAHKPVPVANSSPISYTKPKSRSPQYSIPRNLVDLTMRVAIAKKDLALCVAIIDTTVATPQYRNAKLLKSAMIPAIGVLGLVPLTWKISSYAAAWQMTWDADIFFWMCLGGGSAYLGTMGTLLYITATTWNDHHERVRWIPGAPLARRWIREEERAYFDQMAQSWGYQDVQKFGEEAGEEWDAFREILALRYLDLDRTSLLPGML